MVVTPMSSEYNTVIDASTSCGEAISTLSPQQLVVGEVVESRSHLGNLPVLAAAQLKSAEAFGSSWTPTTTSSHGLMSLSLLVCLAVIRLTIECIR
jgi:hypothetical protein